MEPLAAAHPRYAFPLHLVQRSRRGAACFHGESDCLAYLRALKDCAGRLACAVHAYVLMGNHVHLLFTPGGREAAPALMDALAERHALLSTDAPSSPPVFDASPVHARRYVLSCMRYIELNPVRAGLVRQAQAYRWSSYRANALGEYDSIVTPHPLYYALGRSPRERRAAYQALFAQAR